MGKMLFAIQPLGLFAFWSSVWNVDLYHKHFLTNIHNITDHKQY